VLVRVRESVAAAGRWLWARKLIAAAVLVVVAGVAAGVVLLTGDEDQEPSPAPAPDIVVGQVSEGEAGNETELETEDLGFPAFATKNTTRVAGPDPTANAAGVALAVHPSIGGVPGPEAVSLVDAPQWHAGIAAASLVADPIGAPILITADGEIPSLTANALRALDPPGSPTTDGKQVFLIGAAAKPDGYSTLSVEGESAAELAAAVDEVRQRLAGDPDHVVITAADAPAEAMPAAAWAARSGDPVLFARRESLPGPTRKALEEHDQTPVYVLGSKRAISDRVLNEIREVAPAAERIADDDPTESSIAFARFVDGSFGWNINDPGHGFVIASARQPLDAVAAAPLSASGTWGPLLVTTDGMAIPASLRGYLLDLKPGYEADPTRAVYNHVWLIGDTSVLSVAFQAQADELAEVAPVTPGSGATALAPLPDRDAGGADRGGSPP
jgi:hypothetical protein